MSLSLRLRNDIKEATILEDVSIEQTETPSVAIITFKPPLPGIPNRYIVSVPKFYPHNPPIVRCADPGFEKVSRFWDSAGQVTHPGLTSDWTAMNSLQTVILTLRLIRSEIGIQVAVPNGPCLGLGLVLGVDSCMDVG